MNKITFCMWLNGHRTKWCAQKRSVIFHTLRAWSYFVKQGFQYEKLGKQTGISEGLDFIWTPQEESVDQNERKTDLSSYKANSWGLSEQILFILTFIQLEPVQGVVYCWFHKTDSTLNPNELLIWLSNSGKSCFRETKFFWSSQKTSGFKTTTWRMIKKALCCYNMSYVHYLSK